MPTTDREQAIFDLLCEAAVNHKLALLATTDVKTGEHRAVIAVINETEESTYMLPLGHLSENGMEEYARPEDAVDITSDDAADLIEGALGIKPH